MSSEKKIKYLDYLVHGERVRGAGFLRLEEKNGRCNIALQISGINGAGRNAQGEMPVRILLGDGRREVECADIVLRGGKATGNFQGMNPEDLLGSGIGCAELRTLRVPLWQDEEIVCVIADDGQEATDYAEAVQIAEKQETWRRETEEREGQRREAEENQRREAKERERQRREAEERERQRREAKERERQGREAEERERQRREAEERERQRREVEERERREIEERDRKRAEKEQERPTKVVTDEDGQRQRAGESAAPGHMPAKEDKWLQLQSIYPHITPFQDDREYLSVGPNDFVILSEKYYGLIHNSFLLHGYYNYKHLILQRIVKKGEAQYYIGVPGNFYDREKQVAVMFGFESFESLEEPAREGDYGYYMIPVEL